VTRHIVPSSHYNDRGRGGGGGKKVAAFEPRDVTVLLLYGVMLVNEQRQGEWRIYKEKKIFLHSRAVI